MAGASAGGSNGVRGRAVVSKKNEKGRWRRRRDSNPRYRIYQYDGLANRWFQPLTHVSAWSAALTAVWPRRVAIALGFAPRHGKDCAFFRSVAPVSSRECFFPA